MLYLVMLHTLLITARNRMYDKLVAEPERGSDTIERVIWGVAVVAIAAIGVAAIRAFVTSESGKLGR